MSKEKIESEFFKRDDKVRSTSMCHSSFFSTDIEVQTPLEAKKSSYTRNIIKEEYYAIEIIYQGMRFLFSSHELLKIVQKTIQQHFSMIGAQMKQMVEYSVMNQINGGYTPSRYLEWLTLADYMQQKERGQTTPIAPVVINCGGRKIVIFNPSNRYTFDYGTIDQGEVDMNKAFLEPGGINFSKLLNPSVDSYKEDMKGFGAAKNDLVFPYGEHYMYQESSDAVRHKGKGLTYHALLTEIKKSNFSDKKLCKMVRLLLRGQEPVSNLTKGILRSEPEEDTDPRLLQPFSNRDLEEMPAALPALVVALFGSEVSRNPISLTSSLMLLDLIEIGAKLSINALPVTLENCLKHPDYVLAEHVTQKMTDPTKELIKTGGIHPMAHQGSFEEFSHDKHQLTEPLSWSHVKSAMILIEWLVKYYTVNSAHANILMMRLSKKQYLEKMNKDIIVSVTQESNLCIKQAQQRPEKILDAIYNTESDEEDRLKNLTQDLLLTQHCNMPKYLEQRKMLESIIFQRVSMLNTEFKLNFVEEPGKNRKRSYRVEESTRIYPCIAAAPSATLHPAAQSRVLSSAVSVPAVSLASSPPSSPSSPLSSLFFTFSPTSSGSSTPVSSTRSPSAPISRPFSAASGYGDDGEKQDEDYVTTGLGSPR